MPRSARTFDEERVMSHEALLTHGVARRSSARLFFDLFKLRIGLVIGFTAVAGVAITPGPALPGW